VQLIDVLIVTAVPEEYVAVLEAGGGARVWTTQKGPMDLTVAFREIDAAGGGTLRIAVTQALGMGGANAVIASASLLREYDVQCLAMCGVCAGRRGDVALGDVIVADRVWQYDTGKRKSETVKQKRVVKEEGDVEMYRLHPPAWKQEAERFALDPKAPWLKLRPRSYEAQGDWILERVLRGTDPSKDPGRKKQCVDWDRALDRLWKKKLLKMGTLTLTPAGTKHIRHVLLVNGDKLPSAKRLEVHVGPIASGSKVMQDDGIFPWLSESVRKVLGVEMEVAAIGALAWVKRLPYSVVMKAVMDHADADKSDNFKEFAARASAECLLAFVQKHVPPRGTGEDRVLTTGTSDMPKLAGPAALLNARHQVVPFHGRDDVLESMRRWCEEESNVRARLIHAAGGMGKTRLAIELCRQMREKRWRAGFLAEGDKLGELMESDRPVLAVIDYAESRAGLREMLKSVAGRHPKKVLRVVLLARNADEWWSYLLGSDGAVKDMLSDEEPLGLPSITKDREAIFREAVKAFTGREYEGVVPSLTDSTYKGVLYVHAAALAIVRGPPVHIDALMEDTLEHEERFWQKQLHDRGHAGERKALHKMRLAVAALTLKGGVHNKAQAEALTRDEDMVVLLRDLYPGSPGQRYIGGLEPDLLGEAMVWRTLRKEGEDAGPYLDRVFEGADTQAIRTGFTVLGRLSVDREAAAGWIARLLAPDVAGRAMEAFAAARTLGEQTPHATLGMELARTLEREGTIELAERLEPELPHQQQTVSLREVGRWATQKRLAHLPEGSAPEKRARLLNSLSLWQSVLEQREAALDSAQEAIDIRRKLSESRSEAFLPALAESLNSLSRMQSAFGQYEAALASVQEAVDIRRKLSESRSEAFLPALAGSLKNLSNAQWDLRRREAALASVHAAIDIYRKLSEPLSGACRANLASSLTHLGTLQRDFGQREAALTSAQEAADIYRTLSESRPEAFLPGLAGTLTNLGEHQSNLGRHEAALASSQEAIVIYRKLSESRQEAVRSDLARSLNNLGNVQSALGQHETALTSSQEALDTIWPLFLQLPAAFERSARLYLDNLHETLEVLGKPPSPELLQRTDTFLAMCGG
jgi:nucleoside phosphorylase/tetratricopeptide (TPR) repeat protein